MAGQIGLVPATMEIINGGIKAQSRLSLRHVERILKAINDKASLRNIIFCACYVTHPSYIPIVKEEWAIACSEEKSNIFLQNCLVVPALPRDSLVEWQVVAHISHPEKWICKSQHITLGGY